MNDVRRTQILEVASSGFKHEVSGFKPVSEGLYMLRVTQRFSNTIICPLASAEEKDDISIDLFSDKFGKVCHKTPAHNTKIVMGGKMQRLVKRRYFGQLLEDGVARDV
jgi:hypothetical protein